MYKFFLYLLLPTLVLSKTISFEDAIYLTVKNNKDLKNSNLDIQLSQLNTKKIDAVNKGKLLFSNQISKTNHSGYVFNSKLSSREASFNDFGADEYSNTGNSSIEPKELNYPESRTNINSNIRYELPLFTGFELKNKKEILKLQEKANRIKYNLTKKELLIEVLKAYNSAVVAKEFIKASIKAKESISFVLKSAEAFHKEGLVTKLDVKQAKVYELSVKTKIIEAKNNFDLAIAYLKFLTSNQDISDVKNLKYINLNISNKNSLFDKTINNNELLKIQDIQTKAMKKNIEITKSAYFPTIVSVLEYGFNDNNFTLNTDKDYYNAMIAVNYSLFDRQKDIENQQSKIAYKKAVLELEKAKDYIKLDLEKALLELNSKKKILKEKKEARNLAEDIFEQSKLMYKNQLISMTNLLEQESNLRRNEAQLIEAQFNITLAQAKIANILSIDFTNNKKRK